MAKAARWNGTGATAPGAGKVAKKYTRKITLKIDGAEVTRNASEDEPAYRIEQEDGGAVLKSESELRKAT
ncbi:HVA1 family protein [Rhodobacterales bacterium HKCCE2091]|nr:HVA1 family protein [Rhodobacterales bacterium HKCCE2091]